MYNSALPALKKQLREAKRRQKALVDDNARVFNFLTESQVAVLEATFNELEAHIADVQAEIKRLEESNPTINHKKGRKPCSQNQLA